MPLKLVTEDRARLEGGRMEGILGNSEKQWDFFIAHAGADSGIAESLYERLACNYHVFLDSRSLLPGDDWDLTLATAQSRSRITVVIISSNTTTAYYQREEIAAAIALARDDVQSHRVIPVFVDDSARETSGVPYGLRLKHSISISASGGLEGAAQHLTRVLAPTLAMSGSQIEPGPLAAGQHADRGAGLLRAEQEVLHVADHVSALATDRHPAAAALGQRLRQTLLRVEAFGFACATTLGEARAAEAAGADAVVAQGSQAGGHRGAFDAAAAERQSVGLFALRMSALRPSVLSIGAMLRRDCRPLGLQLYNDKTCRNYCVAQTRRATGFPRSLNH
jgi:hypothetical protein